MGNVDIQPVVDTVDLQLDLVDPSSDEDDPSNTLNITVSSPDSSETQEVMATSIPVGVTLTDGVNMFTSVAGADSVEMNGWDISQLRILPIQNSDQGRYYSFRCNND